MKINDAADLFAAEGDQAREILDALKEEAQDVLELALAEAPNNSKRECYLYAREQVFPLIQRLEDDGERNATLKDVASKLKLSVTDLRNSFAEFVEQGRREQEQDEDDEADLAPERGTERYERAMGLLRCPDILERAAHDMERLGARGRANGEETAVRMRRLRQGGPSHPALYTR